jgi:hypothetical protein
MNQTCPESSLPSAGNSTNRNQLFAFCCFCLIALCAGERAFADTITSRYFGFSGGWREAWVDADREVHYSEGSFGFATTTRRELRADEHSSPYNMGQASVYLDSLNLMMSSHASVGYVPGGNPASSIWSSASATTQFLTERTQLDVSVYAYALYNYYGHEQGMGMTLLDLTAGQALLSVTELNWNETYRFDVDPAHEYELTLWGWIHAYDAKYVNMRMNVQVSGLSVPDGGATLFLLAFAFGPLFAVRARGRR